MRKVIEKATGYHHGVPIQLRLVEIEPGCGKYLSEPAAYAAADMKENAAQDGIELRWNSAWRSYSKQKALREQWVRRVELWERRPLADRGRRPPAPARPGFSNHHNGIAIDINRSHGEDPDGDGKTTIDDWLTANAHKWHFYATVRGEPWHFEFHPERQET